MKQMIKHKLMTWTALLLGLPAIYFFIVNLLKEKFDISSAGDTMNPLRQFSSHSFFYLLSEHCNSFNR